MVTDMAMATGLRTESSAAQVAGRGVSAGAPPQPPTPVKCCQRRARAPDEFEPGEEQSGEVKCNQADAEEEECEPVLLHHLVHRLVHRAIWTPQRKAWTEHGAERRVEHGDELEAHGRGGHA